VASPAARRLGACQDESPDATGLPPTRSSLPSWNDVSGDVLHARSLSATQRWPTIT